MREDIIIALRSALRHRIGGALSQRLNSVPFAVNPCCFPVSVLININSYQTWMACIIIHALTIIILNLWTSCQLLELPSFFQVITNNIYQREYIPNQFLSTHNQNEMHIAKFPAEQNLWLECSVCNIFITCVNFVGLWSCLSGWNVGVLWPNGWMDQDETWHRGRPRHRPYCVRWGHSSPSPKGTTHNFWPISVLAKRLDGTRCHLGGRPRPRPHCVRWGLLPPKGHNPNFRPMPVVAKRPKWHRPIDPRINM